jgi:hypothetical protein
MGTIRGQASCTMTYRGFASMVLVIAGGCAITFLFSRQNELLRESRNGIQGGSDFGLLEANIIVSELASSCASGHLQLKSSSSQPERKSPPNQHQSEVCRNLGDGRTASSIWRAHFPEILEASILRNDEGHKHWTKQLLELVTPEFMARALRTSPSYKDIDRIIRIIDTRLHNATAPPLHVGVFGGSVTEGRIKRCCIVVYTLVYQILSVDYSEAPHSTLTLTDSFFRIRLPRNSERSEK